MVMLFHKRQVGKKPFWLMYLRVGMNVIDFPSFQETLLFLKVIHFGTFFEALGWEVSKLVAMFALILCRRAFEARSVMRVTALGALV